MKYVEAIISELVHSTAILVLDDNGHIICVEDVIEENERYNLEIVEIISEVSECNSDPREVE